MRDRGRHRRLIPATALGRARFAVSPLWETVASLRILATAPRQGLHAPWAAATALRLDRSGVPMARLRALVPATGHLADFLTPAPPRRRNAFGAELSVVAGVTPEVVVHDLHLLRRQSSSPDAVDLLDRARVDPGAFVAAVVDDLEAYWHVAVESYWPRLRALAEADIARRSELFEHRGPLAVLDDLHPRVSTADGGLSVLSTCGEGVVPGDLLVLVPCAFAWPEILLHTAGGGTTTLTYSPRGVGSLWSRAPEEAAGAALAALVGRTRATILAMLDLPLTTTQLAGLLEVGTPATSAHLKVLQRAGLVTARRSGRLVHYARTTLGAELAAAGPEPLVR